MYSYRLHAHNLEVYYGSALQAPSILGSPPRADILLNLSQAANVSGEWLSGGKGEMRPLGLQPGGMSADISVVEPRDMHVALSMEQIVLHLPFSPAWL